MGLDITAYSQIKKLPDVYNKDGEPLDPKTLEPIETDYFKSYLNSSFPGRADDVEDGECYTYADSFGFCAGSYSGYNGWREQLAEMAGYPSIDNSHAEGSWKAAKGPFYELIYFSDCEGVLGTATCKKLLADFEVRADDVAYEDSYFAKKYKEWHKAIKLAANDGCVRFH